MSEPTREPGYIVVEGVIGVGKTSLSRLLSKRLNARLVLEAFEENPFLKKFYTSPEGFAFQTQIFFLLSRFRQQQGIVQGDLFHHGVISDYHFAKDRIFANINLSDEELVLYDQVADALAPRVTRPDLVIYLQASLDTLLDRIDKRGRPMERTMKRGYLETLSDAYNVFFFHYTDTPLLVINTDSIDFVSNSKHLDDLVDRILTPFDGTLYYVPTWASRGEEP